MPGSSSASRVAFCLLPERRALHGPVTTRRIARLWLAYLGLLSLGLAVSHLADHPTWKVLGLGLMVPGGGFLAHVDIASLHGAAHLAAAVMAAIAFIAALSLWFATGNALAPPLTWLLLALAAASMDHGEARPASLWAVPLAALGLMAVAGLLALVRRARAAQRRQRANTYLTQAGAQVAASWRGADDAASDDELSRQDLRLMRFLLDRALQPVGSYEGLEWRDQFQTAAVRYQINFIGYALSMAQATRLPALGGYLSAAQRRLIDKQTDHRIWRYWALENFWGNLAIDPSPVARDNIMFTGFCAAQIAMYHAASGRRDYDRHASFTLRHRSGRLYECDLASLIATLDRERARSAFHLVACEPNWVYPLCNAIGASAMKAHERMTGTARWSSSEADFRRHLENELIDLAGRFVPCRSTYSGLALPVIGGALPQAMAAFFLNATMPDLALRQWLLLRRDLLNAEQSALARWRFWPIDIGNYGFSRAAAFAGTALAAVEMGDREVTRLCLAALDEDCPGVVEADVFHRPHASVWAHAVELFARSGKKSGFQRLIEAPLDPRPRPMIDDVPYPDVLVARAVQAQGGLDAVLYPGASGGRHRLGLSGLDPGATYACEGTEERSLVASCHGSAVVTVALTDRTAIRVRPAA